MNIVRTIKDIPYRTIESALGVNLREEGLRGKIVEGLIWFCICTWIIRLTLDLVLA